MLKIKKIIASFLVATMMSSFLAFPAQAAYFDVIPPTSSDSNSESAPPASSDGSSESAPPASSDGNSESAPPASSDGNSESAPPASSDGNSESAPPASSDGNSESTPPASSDGSSESAPPASSDGNSESAPPASSDGNSESTPPASSDGNQEDSIAQIPDENKITEGLKILPDGRTVYVLPNGSYAKGEKFVENVGWAYFKPDNHDMVKNTFFKLPDGRLVHYNKDGAMLMGKQEIDGWPYEFSMVDGRLLTTGEQYIYKKGWAYIDPNTGIYANGFVALPDKRYVYYKDRIMVFGDQKIDGKYYKFHHENGNLITGEFYVPEKGWAYIHDSSKKHAEGFTTLPDKRYVHYKDGFMVFGDQKIDGKYYKFHHENGNLITGEFYVPEKGWAYIHDSSKKHAEGFTTLPDKRYVHYKDGFMVFGNQKIDGKYYKFHYENGDLITGEFYVPEKGWAYVDPNTKKAAEGFTRLPDNRLVHYDAQGIMLMGKQNIGDWPYEFSTVDGRLLSVGEQYVPGKGWGFVDANTGFYVQGLVQIPDGRLIYYKDGIMTFGWQTINGKQYYFNSSNGDAYRNGVFLIEGKRYRFDEYGVATLLEDAMAIDVSYHQGTIDWKAVADSGVKYAIIRAIGWDRTNQTVGGVDTMFDYNVREAKKQGIKVGAYIYTYAKNETEIATEVNAFLSAMRKLEQDGYRLDMPVFVDQEDPSLLRGLTNADRTHLLRREMVLLQQNGYYPGMYMSTAWSQSYVDAEGLYREGYDMWIADYRTSVQNPVWAGRCALWQYSSTGRVPGINGNVDLNYLYKDYSGLIQGSDNTGGSGSAAKFSVRNENAGGAVVEDTMLNLLAAIVNNEVGSGLGLTGADRKNLYQAQAIAAHSWLLYNYKNSDSIPSVGLNYSGNFNLIREQISSVQDKILTYQGVPALTVYGSANNGKTNASGDYWNSSVPYLVAGIESKYDKVMAPQYFPTISRPRTKAEVSQELKAKHGVDTSNYPDPSKWFVIEGRNSGNYITTLTICGKRMRGGSLNDNFSPIRSSDFTVEYDAQKDNFTFKSYGNGHGIGMSQYGAAGYIAKEGWSYEKVLQHYYPNTVFSTVQH